MFFNKKIFDGDKIFQFNDRFLCQIKILLLNMLKIPVIKYFPNSRFPGFVATCTNYAKLLSMSVITN